MRLRLTPLAAEDIAEARNWYSAQAPALGERFEETLEAAFSRLVKHPRAFPVVYRSTRRAPVSGVFSAYQIFYRLEETTLVVVAVIHTARHPRRWRLRR